VLLVTNHKPQIRGQDWAIWRRIALVPFAVRFWKPQDNPPPGAPMEDPGLAATLLTELPGVLNWAIRGCLAWQRDGLASPPIVQVATQEYRREEDVLGPFIDDCCTLDSAGWVPAKALFDAYAAWTTKTHDRPMSMQAFGRALAGREFKALKQGGTRGWSGLMLTEETLF
jgi:putative DNA primase/helicase